MDNKQVMARIEELLKEKHLTLNALKENTSISTTVYQWKKNATKIHILGNITNGRKHMLRAQESI